MSILSQLKAIPDLSQVPDEQLQWLIDHSELREFQAGERLFGRGDFSQHLFIILEGRIRIWFEQNGTSREMGRMEKDEITGVLPYSRLKEARGNGDVLQKARILMTHRSTFPDMIRTQYELVEALVHVMANRIRNFTTLQVQNEKLVALGKLSAGLAHELNNPSSAVVRVAKDLKSHLAYLPDNFKRVISIRIEEAQVDAVNEMLFEHIGGGIRSYPILDRSRREECLEDWLDDHDVPLQADALDALVDFGFEEEDFDFVLSQTGERDLAPVLNWMGNVLTTEKYVGEIHDASQRINDLVTSIKSYSHMDQDIDRGQVDIREGIRSTRRMLEHKFRKGSIQFEEDFGEPFPTIHANPGELNQVWTNLIDNALDALESREGAVIRISAHVDGPCLKVVVQDNGPGIPDSVKSQIFDPFFTTKGIGKGTGLGLDIVLRIMRAHNASIDVESVPGETRFLLWFPLN